jgi:septal ring-binding cell division protein DamX
MDTGQWELDVFISWATEDQEDSRHFVMTGWYATEEEATAQCIGLPVIVQAEPPWVLWSERSG